MKSRLCPFGQAAAGHAASLSSGADGGTGKWQHAGGIPFPGRPDVQRRAGGCLSCHPCRLRVSSACDAPLVLLIHSMYSCGDGCFGAKVCVIQL